MDGPNEARQTTHEQGMHRDGGKPRISDMVSPQLMWEVGEIFAQSNTPSESYPEGKYPDSEDGTPNYKSGIRVSRMLDSVYRHLLKVNMREDIDPDSGFTHLAHIVCNVAMIYWMIKNRPELDDRETNS